jgi:hypothetical protein
VLTAIGKRAARIHRADVDAADDGDLAVDDEDLAVIPMEPWR